MTHDYELSVTVQSFEIDMEEFLGLGLMEEEFLNPNPKPYP